MALSFGPNRLYAFECLQNVFCTTANHQKKFPSVDSHIVFLLSLLFFSFNFWFTNLNRSKISFDLDFFFSIFFRTLFSLQVQFLLNIFWSLDTIGRFGMKFIYCFLLKLTLWWICYSHQVKYHLINAMQCNSFSSHGLYKHKNPNIPIVFAPKIVLQ